MPARGFCAHFCDDRSPHSKCVKLLFFERSSGNKGPCTAVVSIVVSQPGTIVHPNVLDDCSRVKVKIAAFIPTLPSSLRISLGPLKPQRRGTLGPCPEAQQLPGPFQRGET